MIVCHCRVVSDRDVRAAIDAGAGDPCEVAAACGAGTGCGGCLPEVRRMLAARGRATELHLTPRDVRRRLEEVLAARAARAGQVGQVGQVGRVPQPTA